MPVRTGVGIQCQEVGFRVPGGGPACCLSPTFKGALLTEKRKGPRLRSQGQDPPHRSFSQWDEGSAAAELPRDSAPAP